jgi:hypothetical protein
MPDKKPKVRVIAFYLPQYHPIPENDAWWGKGFTEWVSVKRSRPLFRGHVQPQLPSELGFYDLRDPKARKAQANLAIEHGIEGFCYWHYWLGGGKRLPEKPFQEVLESGEPDFPFCLAWANHDWTGGAFCAKDRLLIRQQYPGQEDYEKHFQFLIKAFKDKRYIKVGGKPLFMIYKPKDIPSCKELVDFWRKKAVENGLPGLYMVADNTSLEDSRKHGLDGALISKHRYISHKKPITDSLFIRYVRKINNYFGRPFRFIMPRPLQRYKYKEAIKYMLNDSYSNDEFPNIVPNWDTTPRLQYDAVIFENATPELFRENIKQAISKVANHTKDHKIIFLSSWNEWAEGNYIEPDHIYGRARLKVLQNELFRCVIPK